MNLFSYNFRRPDLTRGSQPPIPDRIRHAIRNDQRHQDQLSRAGTGPHLLMFAAGGWRSVISRWTPAGGKEAFGQMDGLATPGRATSPASRTTAANAACREAASSP